MAMAPLGACPAVGILVSWEMLALKCGVSCPPGPHFAAPISLRQQGAAAWLRSVSLID